MRFQRLAIPAFGPFSDFTLEFPTGESDCHLIYGPNEAGKTSLLRAIRDLLYGIHGQTPDNFLHDYKDLRIAGSICDSGGQCLSFQRRKGNKNTLLDESGAILPDEMLTRYLGVVDREFFATMFGLGAEGLRQGAEALLHGQGELGQALFSASLAGTPVHRILDALEEEARTLYDGRARTTVSIRPAVAAYEDDRTRSKNAIVHPEVWEQTLQQLADAEHERDRCDAELERQRTRRDWLQRCLDALPTLGALSEREQQQAALPATPDLDVSFVTTAEKALVGRDQARAELNRLLLRVEQLEARVRENQPSRKLLDRTAEIESVHQQLAVYRQHQTEQLALEADLVHAESRLQAGMRELGIAGEPAVVESLRVAVAEELALREAAAALDTAIQRLADNRDRTDRIERDLEKIRRSLGLLPTVDVTALRSALAQTAGAGEVAKGLSRIERAVAAAERTLEAQRGLVWGSPVERSAAFALPVPAAATLRRFETELTRIDNDATRLQAEIMEGDRRLNDLRGELQRLERRGALPSLAALDEARQHREQGWRRVLAAWKEGAEEAELDGRPLAEAYPLRVGQADAVADRLREDAERVAQAEGLRLQLRDLAAGQAEAEAELQRLQASRTDWQARWNTLWSGCSISPASPAEMLEWRDRWLEFRACYEAWEKARDQLASAGADIRNAVEMLRTLLPDGADRSLLGLREQAESKVREADEAQGERTQLQARETDCRSELEKLVAAGPGLGESLERARIAWETQCQLLGLPTKSSPETGLALLDRHKQLVGEFDGWTGRQQALTEKWSAISAYEARIRELVDALGIEGGTVEAEESLLWEALERAQTQRARQSQAQDDLEQEQEEVAQVRQTLTGAERTLAECIAVSGAADDRALQTLLGDLKARQATEAAIGQLRETLHVSARGEPLDVFIERVRAEPADSLTAERDALDQAIPALEAQRDQALQSLAKAEDEKRKLEQCGAEAAEYLQAAQNTAMRIRHDASRYLRLQLARHFLRVQIERFRKQNQAPLLARAGEMFSAITDGSFQGLGTAFTADDTPVLVGVRNGKEVGVEGMSDGTRDQLYLALRLAAIERHQQHHEPMPVILDDLLITFDEPRTRAILPILRDLGRNTQVMLFTHHRHLIELARTVLSEEELHLHILKNSVPGNQSRE